MIINTKFVRVFLLSPFLLAMSCVLLYSCRPDNEKQLTETARAFSDSYFNWQYFNSINYCTSDSKLWLSYMASQVDEQDVNALRARKENASVEVEDVELLRGDSTAMVKVKVRNYLNMDTIGIKDRVVDKAVFIIPMRRDGDAWKVHLTAPLRAARD
ncbi:MAG: hypothetical protein ACOYJK_03525 [Prevotella sp.]|jgi:hypothetical protein